MNEYAEWVTAIGTSVAALAASVAVTGVWIGWKQLKVGLTQLNVAWTELKADHERSRREKAIDLLSEWTKALNPKAAIARKFVEKLSKQQAVALMKQEAFEVDSQYRDLVEGCLDLAAGSNEQPPSQGSNIKLTPAQASRIRWEVICYFNKLESVLAAWRHNVADRAIIEEQFTYLLKPKEGHSFMAEIRAIECDNYPAVDEFAKHLEALEKKKSIPGKPAVV